MFMSPASRVMRLRRSVANLPRISASSSLITAAQLAVVGEDGLELGDGLAQLGDLGLEVAAAQTGEPRQGHVEDVLGLHLGELERRGHQGRASRGAVVGCPDGGDDLVDHVEGLEQAFDDVGPLTGDAQPVERAPPDDLDLVFDVGMEGLDQVERPRDAVDQRNGVHREVRLQRRVLVEVVEDDQAGGVLLQPDHQSGLALGGLVVDVGDAVDLAGLDQLLDLRRRGPDRRLVRHLGDDDLVAALALFDLGDGAQADRALARAVGVDDALAPHDQRAGREVGALHELHELVGRGIGVVDQVDGGVDDLAQVVGRDVGRHADGDALAAVDQQVREPRRQDRGLVGLVGVVGDEVDGALVDAGEHVHRQRVQARLGVAACRRSEVG